MSRRCRAHCASCKPVRLRVLARDVNITISEPHQTSIQNLLPCVVMSMIQDSHPSQILVQLACGETVLLARITARAVMAPAKAVWAQVKSVTLVQ